MFICSNLNCLVQENGRVRRNKKLNRMPMLIHETQKTKKKYFILLVAIDVSNVNLY